MRPIVKFSHSILETGREYDIQALIDTGAYIPVWTQPKAVLEAIGGKSHNRKVTFAGFGGMTEGEYYTLTLRFGKLIFPHMPIILHPMDNVPVDMICSATMFSKLIYEINDKYHYINVKVPDDENCNRNLKLYDRRGKCYVLCEQ